jgi:hypothetical protein
MWALFILAFLVDLVHEIETDLMLETMHAGFLLHLPAFHTLSENIGLTQNVIVGMVDWAVVEMIFGVLARLGIDWGLIQVHHVVDALWDTTV